MAKNSQTVCIDGRHFEWPNASRIDVSVSYYPMYISVEIFTNLRDNRNKGPLQTVYNIYEEEFKYPSIIADFFMVYNTFGGYTTHPDNLKMECRKSLKEMEVNILNKLLNDNIPTVDIDEIVASAMFRAIWNHTFHHLEHLRNESLVDNDDYEKESEEFLARFKTDLHEVKDVLERCYQEAEAGYKALFRKE